MPVHLTHEEKARRANWERNCAACSKVFGWSKNGDAARYCSRACAGRAVGVIPRGPLNQTRYVCVHCKEPFESYHKGRKFCCRRCCAKSRNGVRVNYSAAGAKDQNHDEIVAALIAAGVSVLDTSAVGCGMPDLVVGFGGFTGLVEIKNLKNKYGRKGLNKNQAQWFADWKGGPAAVVGDVDGALRFARVLAWKKLEV